jgi:hypothetical protein
MAASNEMKLCIACAEEIKAQAALCKHCNTRQDEPIYLNPEVKVTKGTKADLFSWYVSTFESTCGFLKPERTEIRLSSGDANAIRFSPKGVGVTWLYILHNDFWYSLLEDGESEIKTLNIREHDSHTIAYPVYISGRLAAVARSQSNKKAREQAEETLSQCIDCLDDAAHPVTTYFKQFLAGDYSNQWINKEVAAEYRAELRRLQ